MDEDLIAGLCVKSLGSLYRRGELSPVEVVEAQLSRCSRINPKLNAFISVLAESALLQARGFELLLKAGVDLGPLHGVPVTVKDVIRVKGSRTTAASRVLAGEPPDACDAHLVQQLRAAGAIIIGKTNLHEFASGDPDDDSPFGWVQNPHRIGYHAGMSSSGAAASVAAGLGMVAIGTDTGGSVRVPASLCGVVGLKPTLSRISTEGVIPLSPTLDTIGFLGRCVDDVAAAWRCLAAGDGSSHSDSGAGASDTKERVRGLRVGVFQGGPFDEVQEPVQEAFNRTLRLLKECGCSLVELHAPDIDTMNDLSLLLTRAEAAAYHERYREKESLYGRNFVAQRLLPGRGITAVEYLSALCRRSEFEHLWRAFAERTDVLATPAGPMVAPAYGIETIRLANGSLPYRAALSRFARAFNCLGWPALTVPNGMSEEGLPIGVQIAGAPDTEDLLLAVGSTIEEGLSLSGRLQTQAQRRSPT